MKRIGAKTDATDTAYIDKDGELTPVQTFSEYQKSGKYWEPPKGPKKVKYLTAGEREAVNKLKVQVSQEKTSKLASNPNPTNGEIAETKAAQLDAGQEALSTPEMTGDYKTDELLLAKAAEKSTPTKEQLKIDSKLQRAYDIVNKHASGKNSVRLQKAKLYIRKHGG